ncbi:molybdate ABC transporter substrate-binding protein [uncultured Fusobacterium sp.]|jgi:molybdate transport system substrate-binding protein|uniref:molybdate ABC transporter substrate-binding protein n=1 Tax=uncultured Fusobacterium sp. TaxID=159267 RepID=UPI0025F068AF|nr:molybdate ABC transporter substrate-binding protein [uncultured Fusobacterium sp.]
MKKLTILILALLLSVSAFSKEIVVSAAASLKNCLEEILPEYEKLSGDKVLLNLGGSGTLRTQIENGVPVDLFISADQKNVKILVDKDMAKKENTYDFLSNSLILVKSPYSKSNINSIEGLNSDIYLVIGNPDTAPVGNYTLTALKNLEILDKLNREKLVYAKDVSAVVQYVEIGEADFGVIYNSDRNRMKNPIVVEEFPENSYDKVIYSVAILNNSDDVKKLFEFLRENKEVFKKYGFVVM